MGTGAWAGLQWGGRRGAAAAAADPSVDAARPAGGRRTGGGSAGSGARRRRWWRRGWPLEGAAAAAVGGGGGPRCPPRGGGRMRVPRACRQVNVLDPRRWRAGRSGGGESRPRAAAGSDGHGVAGRGAAPTRGSAGDLVPLGAAAGRTRAAMSAQWTRGCWETALVATGRRRRVAREARAGGATPGTTVAAASPTTIPADRREQYKGHWSACQSPLRGTPSIAAVPGSTRLSVPSSATLIRVASTLIVPSPTFLVPSTVRAPVVRSSPSWPPPSSGCCPPP